MLPSCYRFLVMTQQNKTGGEMPSTWWISIQIHNEENYGCPCNKNSVMGHSCRSWWILVIHSSDMLMLIVRSHVRLPNSYVNKIWLRFFLFFFFLSFEVYPRYFWSILFDNIFWAYKEIVIALFVEKPLIMMFCGYLEKKFKSRPSC